MSLRRLWPIAVGLAVLWGILGYASTKPADANDYRTVAVSAAKATHDALATAALAVQLQLAGDAFGPYLNSVLSDAIEATAGATRRYAELPPADADTSALRDRLGPLLLDAVRALGDLQRAEAAGDTGALQVGVAAIGPLTAQLTDLIEQYQ